MDVFSPYPNWDPLLILIFFVDHLEKGFQADIEEIRGHGITLPQSTHTNS